MQEGQETVLCDNKHLINLINHSFLKTRPKKAVFSYLSTKYWCHTTLQLLFKASSEELPPSLLKNPRASTTNVSTTED